MALSVKVKIKYSGTKTSQVSNSSGLSSNGSSSGTSYTVKSGDTLWAISKTYLGSGIRYKEIYELNKDIIENTARAHGKSSSENGHWIWAGTVLQIPGEVGGSSSANKNNNIITEDISENISSQLTAFSYTDVATGKSDSISVTVINIDKEWLGSKMPERGASLDATIKTKEWGQGVPSFSCGNFTLDDISFSGRPLSCVLSAVSVPTNDDFKSKQKTITWQSTTLKDIAEKIASAAGVKLYYSGDSIKITDLEQSKQTDSAFLAGLCDKYGYSIKVFNNKIVIFDSVKAETAASVLTLKEKEMLNWNYNTTIEGTYTGIEFSYTNPDTSSDTKTLKVKLGKEGRMYTANSQASSRYDAELQARAILNKANRGIETMSITIRANNSIVAGQCVNIAGLGKINGKYYIDQIKHSIGSGYNMQLALHKVQASI